MPLNRSNFEKRHLSPRVVEVSVSATITSSGAVASVVGKGFSTGPSDTGTVARSAAGVYVITLPGRGAVQRIVPKCPVIQDGAPADLKLPMVTAMDLSARTITWTFFDALGDGTPAAEELTDGTIVHFNMDVHESDLG